MCVGGWDYDQRGCIIMAVQPLLSISSGWILCLGAGHQPSLVIIVTVVSETVNHCMSLSRSTCMAPRLLRSLKCMIVRGALQKWSEREKREREKVRIVKWDGSSTGMLLRNRKSIKALWLSESIDLDGRWTLQTCLLLRIRRSNYWKCPLATVLQSPRLY